MTAPLFMAGEFGGFVPSSGGVLEVTTAGTFDPAWARCAINVESTADYAESAVWAQAATFFWHEEFYHTGATLATGRMLSFYDGATEVFRLDHVSWSGNTATYQMYYWNGSAFVAIGSSFSAPDDTRHALDIYIKAGVSGEAQAVLAGTLRAEGTADMSAFGGITKTRLRAPGTDVNHSQCCAHTEPTVGGKVNTIPMTGNGANTAWTGDFTNIDEAVYNDGDLITSSVADQIETYTGTPVASFTGYVVRALAITARVKDNGSTPDDFRFILRSGGTDYDNGSDIALTIAYGAFCATWEDNPDTAAAFLSTEFAALEYGLKSRA